MHFVFGLILLFRLHWIHALSADEITILSEINTQYKPSIEWVGEPSCSWKRLVCDENGNVIQLDLCCLEITGSLLPSFAKFPALKSINLSNNKLTSAISVLTNISTITYLDVSVNQLTESLPSAITSWKSITTLILDSNQLSGPIPSEIGQLTTLEYLSLSSNKFTSLPSSFESLVSLRYL